jgi:hypothetical protein
VHAVGTLLQAGDRIAEQVLGAVLGQLVEDPAQRDPEVRAAVADGIEDARAFWAQALYGVDPADQERARAVGSLHQALVSGVLVQWLIDPDRAPSPVGLAAAMATIAAQVAPA